MVADNVLDVVTGRDAVTDEDWDMVANVGQDVMLGGGREVVADEDWDMVAGDRQDVDALEDGQEAVTSAGWDVAAWM